MANNLFSTYAPKVLANERRGMTCVPGNRFSRTTPLIKLH